MAFVSHCLRDYVLGLVYETQERADDTKQELR